MTKCSEHWEGSEQVLEQVETLGTTGIDTSLFQKYGNICITE